MSIYYHNQRWPLSVYVLEKTWLQSNAVSHWLGAHLESALIVSVPAWSHSLGGVQFKWYISMSISVCLHDLVHEEEYNFSLPSAYARSILTVPWVELGDRVTLTCAKTGYSASIIFHTKPFYGGKLHRITAEVKNPVGENVCKVAGEWNGVMEFTYANVRACHYGNVIMSAMASQITSLMIVCATVYSSADQRKLHSASLAFVRGIHRWPVNSPHKGPVMRKMFPFDNVIMLLARRVMGWCKMTVTPVHQLWRYMSCKLTHWYFCQPNHCFLQ